MPKCHVCGRGGIFFATYRCEQCGQEVCEPCLRPSNGVCICSKCEQWLIPFFSKSALDSWKGTCPLCSAKDSLFVESCVIYRQSQMTPERPPIPIYQGPILHRVILRCRDCGNSINDHILDIKANRNDQETNRSRKLP